MTLKITSPALPLIQDESGSKFGAVCRSLLQLLGEEFWASLHEGVHRGPSGSINAQSDAGPEAR